MMPPLQDYWHMEPNSTTLTLREALNDYACGAENAMSEYLSRKRVADAIHVRVGTKGMRYKRTVGDLVPLMKRLIEKHRVLIYSGDVDGKCAATVRMRLAAVVVC